LYRDPAQRAIVDQQFQALLAEPGAVALMERDEAPLPATDDREGYFGDRHLSYWLSGLADLRIVRSMIPDNALANVLDFGGANGRFARHVGLAHPGAQVTVADISLDHVDWVDEHFGPAIRGLKLSPYPHLPLPDGTATLCVGLSVFTHIDSYETGWLAEIHRVLAVGGYAFLTIHSEDTWQILTKQPVLLELLRRDPAFVAAYEPPRPMPGDRLVYTYNPNTIEHNCNVFVASDYVRRRWGKWFEVVEIRFRAHHEFQTVVVLRKRG
jgi:SAM-dependent methyltransferase